MTMTTPRFAPLDASSAPPGARPLVAASHQQFGFTPSPVAKAARSPALLKHLLAGFGAFDRSSLAPLEREVVALTVAFHNECHYCMAMHSTILTRQGEDRSLVASLRAGAPLEAPRLEALRRFTNAVLARRGHVTDEELQALEAAGFSEEQALDVVLGIGVYVLSTFTNSVVRVEVDPAFAEHAWQPPAQARPRAPVAREAATP